MKPSKVFTGDVRVLSIVEQPKDTPYGKKEVKDRIWVEEKGQILWDFFHEGLTWDNTPEMNAAFDEAERNRHALEREFVKDLLVEQGRPDVKFRYVAGDTAAFVLDDTTGFNYGIQLTALSDVELAAMDAQTDSLREKARLSNIADRIRYAEEMLKLAMEDLRAANAWDGKSPLKQQIKAEWETRDILNKIVHPEWKRPWEDTENIILTEVVGVN